MVLMVFILPVICGDDDSKGNKPGQIVFSVHKIFLQIRIQAELYPIKRSSFIFCFESMNTSLLNWFYWLFMKINFDIYDHPF